MTTIGNVSGNNGEFRSQNNTESQSQGVKTEDNNIWGKYDRIIRGGNKDGIIQENELRKALNKYFKDNGLSNFIKINKEKLDEFINKYVNTSWSKFKTDDVIKFIQETKRYNEIEQNEYEVKEDISISNKKKGLIN